MRFPTPGPIRLEVSTASGDIEVRTVEDQESTVTLEGAPEVVDAARVELDGDRLVVEQRRTVRHGLFTDNSLFVVAHIPRRSGVRVSTASGDSRLEGTFGALELRSASGDLEVRGEIEGDVRAKSASGSVHLPDVHGDVDAQTVSGDLTVAAVEGSVRLRSVSGNARVGSLREGRVNVQNVSGDVALGVASGTIIDLDAGSASGQLSSEVSLCSTPGDATGPTVVIRGNTVSGDFHVFRAAPPSASPAAAGHGAAPVR
jgi:DUF4097 and DUF4098 domain-containing protein YvlB